VSLVSANAEVYIIESWRVRRLLSPDRGVLHSLVCEPFSSSVCQKQIGSGLSDYAAASLA
jgi:hypothetical protein